MRKQPDLADVATDQQDLGQQVMITVNREAAARYGINMASIDEILYSAFGQQQIATIYTPVYQYHVILEVAPEYRNTFDALESIYVTPAGAIVATRSQAATGVTADFSTKGNPMPLASFAELEKRLTPLVITHQGQFPAITVSFNLPPGVSLGQALETLRRDPARNRVTRARSRPTSTGKAAEFASSLDAASRS